MNNDEALEMTSEALNAYGQEKLIRAWYEKWKPGYVEKFGFPTVYEAQNCFMIDEARRLLREMEDSRS